MGVSNLVDIFDEKYYRHMSGGFLEAFGKLFEIDLKVNFIESLLFLIVILLKDVSGIPTSIGFRLILLIFPLIT